MHVYLTTPAPDGTRKIGISVNPKRRAKQVGQDRDCRVTADHVIETGETTWLEYFLHTAFASKRVVGEWFKLSTSDVRIIKSLNRATEEKDLPTVLINLNLRNRSSVGTECVRLHRQDAMRIRAIAKSKRISVPKAYARYGRKNIDRVYREIVLGQEFDVGGEAGGA